jgi:PAS domain S-box-containing protein
LSEIRLLVTIILLSFKRIMDILNSILDNIDQFVIITNPGGELLFFNKEAEHTIGTLRKEPLRVGENLLSYVSKERKKVVTEVLQDLNVRKETIKTWAEYTQLNGLTMHLELNYIPVLDEMLNLSYISLLGRDITSSKIFEKKIRAQAANVENLIQKANAVIMSTDSRGYITNWNDHCTHITGFEKNEVYAKRLTDVVLDESIRFSFNDLINRILNGEAVHNYEAKIKTKDGRILTCLMSATPQLTTTGQAVGITFVGQDITELTEYRRSLEDKIEERTVELRLALQKEKELVELKTRFVSIASHEFRTPLSSIQFAANFLKQYHHRIEEHERHQKLDNIVSQVEHMTSLLDDVLTYGKSEAGKINLITSNIRLADFVTKISEEVGYTTRNTHKTQLEFHHVPSEIETDEKLLRSILSNLLTNAIKFSPGREKVYLTVEGFGRHVQLIIRDEGIGIPEEELENIFEPFLRGKGVASIPGTGLGLSITKKAVELLGGSLKAESQVDVGTTFSVLIPF